MNFQVKNKIQKVMTSLFENFNLKLTDNSIQEFDLLEWANQCIGKVNEEFGEYEISVTELNDIIDRIKENWQEKVQQFKD